MASPHGIAPHPPSPTASPCAALWLAVGPRIPLPHHSLTPLLLIGAGGAEGQSPGCDPLSARGMWVCMGYLVLGLCWGSCLAPGDSMVKQSCDLSPCAVFVPVSGCHQGWGWRLPASLSPLSPAKDTGHRPQVLQSRWELLSLSPRCPCRVTVGWVPLGVQGARCGAGLCRGGWCGEAAT